MLGAKGYEKGIRVGDCMSFGVKVGQCYHTKVVRGGYKEFGRRGHRKGIEEEVCLAIT